MVVRDAKRAAILFFARGGRTDRTGLTFRTGGVWDNKKEKTSVSKSSLGG